MKSPSKSLSAEIALCMVADQFRLRQRYARLKKTKGSNEAIERLTADISTSQQKRAQRLENLPRPSYPEELPVSERREEIAKVIAENQVVIVAGETGSGKTTQLPKICLEVGRGVAGLIGHTQPRRIAARSVASRIASELKTALGHSVGYKVRFSDHTRPESYIKLMTDGILLAESQHDRYLNQYDTLIIDEAHERSLNIDFLLGYLKKLLPKRPDLKLIITSATIDTERFAKHFNDAPIIEVSGRTYPVEMHYRPLAAEDEEAKDRDMQQAILDAVDEAARLGQGDVLIFLPGEREIRETAESLRKHHPPHTESLPLYARLSAAEQNKVFQTHKGRRIVLATNVAETSLTVPGIRYVIDPGLARVSRYSHRTKVQRLPIEKISQASANQRAGRCGRIGPGVCFRLYSELDFINRTEFTEPEIKRSNLAAVILQMKSLHLGDVENFPFVESPDQKMISDGYKLLQELGAMDEARNLTATGKQLAKLPVDPRIGRMVLAAKQENCLEEVLIIASALSVQEPRERPHERQQAADEKHRQFRDEQSDFLAYLNLWRAFHEKKQHLSQNKLRKWCQENFISYLRMREWHDVHAQLHTLVTGMGWRPNQTEVGYAEIHRALLTGLLGNVANKTQSQEYTGARGIKLHIFPGSGLFKKQPPWFMAAELVETTRLYARLAAKIEPEWIEQVAAELCKRNYYEPHWEKKPAAVMAYERLTLYGLIINPKRKVHYSQINPAEARQIFIREALVGGDFQTQAKFLKHNHHLISDIETLEAKSRRRDVLVEEQVVYDFYDQRIPHDVYDGRRFERWRKTAEAENKQLLYLSREDLMRHEAAETNQAQFPDTLQISGMNLALSYHFEPGSEDDGVTVTVPLAALNLLQPQQFDWLVPGLLHEKICQLLKSLPKSLRRNFVPVPNFADACIQRLKVSEMPLTEALQQQLMKISGIEIKSTDWDLTKLDPHLTMNFKIIDEAGETINAGRDLQNLQQQLESQARQSFAAVPAWQGERENITRWDFDALPESVEFESNGVTLHGFPALVDNGDSVSIKLCDSKETAALEMRLGLRRLVMLQMPDKIKYANKNLPGIKQMCLHYAPMGQCSELQQELVNSIIDQAFFSKNELPRTKAAFEACLSQGKNALITTTNEVCGIVADILSEHHQLTKKLKGVLPPTWLHAVSDIQEQLNNLICPHFISTTPPEWLREYPRYLTAINKRLEKLSKNPARDRQQMLEIKPLMQAYLERKEKHQQLNIADPELEAYRYMIEELRVSLFAQELKTKIPVSVKRVKKQLQAVK